MQLFDHLLDLHELAVREGRQLPARRPLFEVLCREKGRHLTATFAAQVRFRGCDPLIKEILSASFAIGRREAAALV